MRSFRLLVEAFGRGRQTPRTGPCSTVRETAGFCIYCSDPRFNEGRRRELVLGYRRNSAMGTTSGSSGSVCVDPGASWRVVFSGRVDPDGGRQLCGPRRSVDEALGVSGVRGGEQHCGDRAQDRSALAVMDHGRGEEARARCGGARGCTRGRTLGRTRERLRASRSGPGTRAGTSGS